MRYLIFSVLTLLAISIFSCTEDPKMPLDGPEFSIRKWQGLVDSSNFEAAKMYSTERTIKWLEKNKTAMESGDSLGYIMNFKEINCKITGDSAICSCKYTMNGDTSSYNDKYFVKKVNNRWLVDLSNDEIELFQ